MLHMACSLARTHALTHARTHAHSFEVHSTPLSLKLVVRVRASPLLDRSQGGKCYRTQCRIAHGS
jgi:hypothetical protein